MPTLGNWTWFDQALLKIANPPQTIDLGSDTFKVALTTSSQVLSKSFSGSSTDCRYADLTAEVITGQGYTLGGATLSGVTLVRSASTVTWSSAFWQWTFAAGGISARYMVIYDNTATNKDLVCFVDLDVGGSGNVSISTGDLVVAPTTSGILYWSTV